MAILLYPVRPRRPLYSWNKWIYGLRGIGRVGQQVGNKIVWQGKFTSSWQRHPEAY